MSRELISLPMVKPTRSPRRLKTSTSSGSGTLQRASERIPTGAPGPMAFVPCDLKKISGRAAS